MKDVIIDEEKQVMEIVFKLHNSNLENKYPIPLSKIRTKGQLTDWLSQLLTKSWIDFQLLRKVIFAFDDYFNNRNWGVWNGK